MTDADILLALARIEQMLKDLQNTSMKIIYALIGIVGATIGVEFLPKSPANPVAGVLFLIKYLVILGGSYTTLRFIDRRRKV